MTSQAQHEICKVTEARAVPGRGRAGGVLLLALALTGLLTIGARVATAKPLFVIAETLDPNIEVPVLTCDIGPNGTLARQAKHTIPLYGAGAVGLALDPASERLFVTYRTSNVIQILNASTLRSVGMATAKGTNDLYGVVYDHNKSRLYCVARGTPNLYVYEWKPATDELIPVPDSPFRLEGVEAWGLALDEARDELYVGSVSTAVKVYSTSDWHRIRTISTTRVAIAVAVDTVRNYLYYGGGLVDDFFLVRHDLTDDTEKEVLIGKEAGVVGLAVDLSTGFVFTSSGSSTCYCGHDLLSYDSNLKLLDALRMIGIVGNPGGIAIPGDHIPYNRLCLTKTVKTLTGEVASDTRLAQVTAGEELTYSICFDHNDLPLTAVTVVDTLPAELEFVRATGDEVYGQYDEAKHAYTWSDVPLAGGPRKCLELVGRIRTTTPEGRIITNSVTLRARETPVSQADVDVVTIARTTVYEPLHVTKTVIAGTTGGGEATLPSAFAGDEITYRISYDNKGNTEAVENIRLTDTLPPDADFVRAIRDILYGRYDADTRTYTWTFPKLAAGDSNSVDLVVRLHNDVRPGTTVTNTATITSDQTSTTRTSVAILANNFLPLTLRKTLVGGAVGTPDEKGQPYVDAGSTLTYRISCSNPATNKFVTQVILVDTLPPQVSFVNAEGDRDFGTLGTDPKTGAATYTWQLVSLAPGAEKSVSLIVRVNDRVDPNTVISNTVTVTSAQTSATSGSLNVVVRTPVPSLRLQKALVKGAVGQPDKYGRPYVDPGTELTYEISFGNPATHPDVTDLVLVDTLPPQVSFVSAEGDRVFGAFATDPKTGLQTYTWRYPSLASGAEQSVRLVVRVNDKVDPNTVITNKVEMSTGQTATAQTVADVVVRLVPVEGQMYAKPDHIYRNSSTVRADLMVVVHLPEGVGMGTIRSLPLILTLEDVMAAGQRVLNPGNIVATGQLIFGSKAQGKVLCFFDTDAILRATEGYGEFPFVVTGSLLDGRFFHAHGSIWIVKFGGP